MAHYQPIYDFDFEAMMNMEMDPMLLSGFQPAYAGDEATEEAGQLQIQDDWAEGVHAEHHGVHQSRAQTGTANSPQYNCPICPASYKRLGDLKRHQAEKHAAPKYLCPIEKCPRGIEGEGFGRMHHLVSHLKSKKHAVESKEARFIARQHNPLKSRARDGGN